MVSILMDSGERIDKFISNNLSFREVAMGYYIYFIPWINGELWPLFAFLSVIFFTSRMARNSEIISLLGAGMNYTRILQPMILSGFIIAGLHWYGENYVIPKSTFYKNEFESKYIKTTIKTVLSNNVQFFLNPNQKIYCRYFQKRDSVLKTFRLETFDDERNLKNIFKAASLQFKEEPNLWTAKDYEIRSFNELEEGVKIGKGETKDTTIEVHPSDFIRHSKQMEIMTTPALKDFISREKEKGLDNTKKYAIEIYKRTAAPFTIILLTIIGACIGTRKVRGGLGMHLATGVALGASFVLISKFTETFANNLSFTPLLGVWMPNILFAGLTIYLLSRAQK
jgi:lipopolysaccharide export system permease protein